MNFRPRILLWDLDGTLAYWSGIRIIPDVVHAYAAACPSSTSKLSAIIAGARAYVRVLGHQGMPRNDALFARLMAFSLSVSVQDMRLTTERFLNSALLRAAIKRSIRPIHEALELFLRLASRDSFRHVVATNPIMPSRFNAMRLAEAGYPVERFAYICGSEDFSGQKHLPSFYPDLLARIGARADEVLMIGNDPKKDLAVGDTGIRTFLLQTAFTVRRRDWPGKPDWEGSYRDLEQRLGKGGA